MHTRVLVCGVAAAASKVPELGLVAWYKSSALGQDGNGGTKWASSVGSLVAKPLGGTVETVTTTGHGAKGLVRMVTGATTASYTFGDILADHYTICSMTRYTGSHKQRILQGTKTNWLHGHWNGAAGVARYSAWLGQKTTRLPNVDDWVVLCGRGKRLMLDGKTVATRITRKPGNQGVVINSGTGALGLEKSDWGVAEVIAWNRALSEKEMQDASAYLKQILVGWSTCMYWLLFWGWGTCMFHFGSQCEVRTYALTSHAICWDADCKLHV